tara:strand:+ start:2368 stop:2763 length:396 start_codon:yes stop_codon:yes gene_type:complete
MTTKASKFDWPTNDVVWAIRDYKLIVGKYDYQENKITSLVSDEIDGTDELQIHYESKSTKFTTNIDLEPDYPSQFHEGIMFKVLEQLWIQKGDANRAAYYKNEYTECVMMAKKYINENKDGTSFVIAQHSM